MVSLRSAIVLSLSASLTVALSACSGAPDESSGATEDAIKGGSPATNYPESADVSLYQNGQLAAYCSGTVIAPKVVLTAGHCVDGFNGWTVSTPFAGQSARASGAATRYAATGENVNPNSRDVGLIFLQTPIHLASYPSIASSAAADGTKANNVGRILNGRLTNSMYNSPAIRLRSAASIGFPYDYTSVDEIQPGDSGGPVMKWGTHEILAVNSSAGRNIQVLARVDLVASWIHQEVASHR